MKNKLLTHVKKNEAIYIPALVTVFFVLFVPLFYHEVDDRFLQDMAMSASYNEHSEFLCMMSPATGYVLRWLTLVIPSINWLAVLYYTIITLGFFGFFSFVKEASRDTNGRMPLYACLALTQGLVLMHTTFTFVSFIGIAGAAAYGLGHIKYGKRLLHIIPMFFLGYFAAGTRNRYEVVWVVLALASPLMLYMLKKKKTTIVCAVLVAVTLLAGLYGSIATHFAHLEKHALEEVAVFHKGRSALNDTAWFDYDFAASFYQEQGISQNDLKMARQLLICDKSIFSADKMWDMANGQTNENKYNTDIAKLASGLFSNLYFICFSAVFLLVLLLAPEKWFYLSAIYGGSGLFMTYLYARQRAEIRTFLPVLIVAGVYMLLCMCDAPSLWLARKIIKTEKASRIAQKIIIVLFVALLGVIGLKQYYHLYIEYHALESRNEIFAYVEENPDVYVTASAWTRNLLYSKQIRVLEKNIKDHKIHSVYGDWYLYYPYYYARMEKLGLGDYAEKALLLPIERSDCYFLTLNDEEITMLVNFYQQYYNLKVEAIEIDAFNENRFKLYRFEVTEG